jgi:cytochrome c1
VTVSWLRHWLILANPRRTQLLAVPSCTSRNEETLDHFLENPLKTVPGTKMGYAGVKDPQERADLIAYLKQATAASTTCK